MISLMRLQFLQRVEYLKALSVATVDNLPVSQSIHLAGQRVAVRALRWTDAIAIVAEIVAAWLDVDSDLYGRLALGAHFGHFVASSRVDLYHEWGTLRVLPS